MESLSNLLKVTQKLNSGAWIPPHSLTSGFMQLNHDITLWVVTGGDELPVM